MNIIKVDCLPLSIFVGYERENDARGVTFDYSAWAEKYGDGVLQLLVQRPGDADPYPVVLTAVENNTAVWLLSATDTAVKGQLEIQLIFTVGSVVAKTAVLPVLVDRSLAAGATPPDPYETWVDELLEIGNKILQDYQAPKIVGGYWYEFDTDLGEYVNTGVKAEGQDGVGISSAALNADYTLTLTFSDGTSYTTPSIRGEQGETGATPALSIGTVTTLPAGSPATAEMTGTPEAPVLNLGVPQGPKGDAGNGDMIADDFSTSTAYAAGDYAIYNGHLYRFTASHAAGAWIGTDAVQVQLAEDVTDLKSALSVVYDGNPSASIRANMELGNIAINISGWSYSASDTRVRTKQGYTIKLYKGDVIGLSDYSDATFYLGWRLPNGTYDRKGWNEADYTVKADGEYVVCMRNKTETTLSDASILSDLFFVKQAGLADVNANTQSIDGYAQLTDNLIKSEGEESGYLSNSGTIQGATANKEKTSTYIDVVEGEVLYFLAGMKAAFWSVACFYNASKQMIGSRYYFSANENDDAYTVNGYHVKRAWFVVPTGATYIRISYRTLNGCYRFLARASASTNHLFDGALFRNGTNHIKSIAHKGFGQPYPENTKVSFWGAVKAGFDAIETDIRFTSDSVPVCLHGASINATGRNADGTSISGTVNIADITYATALTYDFGYYKAGAIFAGQKIPTFEEYLTICRNGGLEPYIEVKVGTDAQIKIVTDIVKAYGMADKCTFIGDVSILAKVVANLPSVRLGSIVNTITTADINSILALKNSENEVFMDANAENLTDALIAECRDSGLPLEAWTIDKTASIVSLNPYVTGVTSNAVVASDALSNSITF